MNIMSPFTGLIYADRKFVGLNFGASVHPHQKDGPTKVYEEFGVAITPKIRPVGVDDRRTAPCKMMCCEANFSNSLGAPFRVYYLLFGMKKPVSMQRLTDFGLCPTVSLSMGWSSDRFGMVTNIVEYAPLMRSIADAAERGRLAFQFSSPLYGSRQFKVYNLDVLPRTIRQQWDNEVLRVSVKVPALM